MRGDEMTIKRGVLSSLIIMCWLLLAGPALSADLDITIESTDGDVSIINVNNRYGVPVYLYDLIWSDGSSVDIHEDISTTLSLEIQGDVAGIVKARCTGPSTAPPSPDYFTVSKDEDGFYHLTAEVL